MIQQKTTTTNTKDVVMSCIEALNNEQFKLASNYMSDDMVFSGVLVTRNGAEAYMKDMEKMKLKYNVKKTFVDGDDVCILSDLTMSGITLFCCSWYHVKNNKINSLRVVFDPRPVLELSGKK
jgi:hypothetical protein